MWNQIFGVGDLDRVAFTKFVAAEGVKRGLLVAPNIDAEAMSIRDANSDFNLQNLYPQFLLLPRRKRLAFIVDHVLGMMEPVDTSQRWAEMQSRLRPVIRHSSYLAAVQLTCADPQGTAASVPNRRVAAHLHATLAIDEPRRMILVTDQHLAEWNVSFAQALEAAHRNLLAAPAAIRDLIPGLWKLEAIDAYTNARVLLPQLLRDICPTPLIAIPNRDVVMVADASNAKACDALLMLMSSREKETYPVTKEIHQLNGNKLQLWQATSDNPELVRNYMNGLHLESADLYSGERELAARVYGPDLYAELVAFEVDGNVITHARWIAGAPRLLPRTHMIEFVDPAAGRTRLVPWSTVADAGLINPVSSAAMPRWNAATFPSEEWLAANAIGGN